jgi:flagellar biosynthetic protein FliR
MAIALPHLHLSVAIPLEPAPLVRMAIGELTVGAVIGLTVRVTLAAAEVAGSIAAFSMGLGFANTVDPTFGESHPPPATALALLAVAIFMAFQGHHAVIAALAATLHSAPPGQTFHVIAGDGVMRLGSRLMAQGLRISAPVVATMFLVQLGTALVSRAAPRVQLFALTFAIAASAGMLTLFVAAPSLASAITAEIQRLPDLLRDHLGRP